MSSKVPESGGVNGAEVKKTRRRSCPDPTEALGLKKIKDAARELGISPRFLTVAVHKGLLPGLQVGRAILVSVKQVAQELEMLAQTRTVDGEEYDRDRAQSEWAEDEDDD